MKKVLLFCAFALMGTGSWAQFQTAAIDGVISPGEYANTWTAADGVVFHMTWDDTYLYFGVDGFADISDAVTIYIDTDPQALANSGTDANGNIRGLGYGVGGNPFGFYHDGNEYFQLPFRANFASIQDQGFSRLFRSNGAGVWLDPAETFDRGENVSAGVKECRILWTAINGLAGRPAAFNIFFFLTSNTPNPTGIRTYSGCSNPGDNDFANLSSLTGRHYFNVGQTTNALAGTAFGRLSFINSRTTETIYGFGAGNSYWDVASADGQVLLIDKGITVSNQLRIEAGSTLRPVGDQTITFVDINASISNLGFMDANPSFGNTMNYVINGIAQAGAGSNPIDVYNMTINGIFNMNNVDLRTGNNGTITVANNGALTCGTGIVGTYAGTSSFVMAGNSNIGIGSVAGISLAPAATGNIRTTNRTYPASGGYVYGALSGNTLSQVTGNGLPATVRLLAAVNGSDLTLNAPLTVTEQLLINNHNIRLNGNDLTLSAAAIFGRTAPGHVITYNGVTPAQVIKSDISSAFTFHVGAGSDYLPVTVAPSSNATFRVGVFSPAASNGVAGGPAFSSTILNNLVNATWNIDRTAGSGATDVTISWPAALEGAGFATQPNSNIGISRFNSGWSGFLATSADNATNTVTASFSSFSPFIVGSSATSLPVSFTAFNGRIENGKVRLSWTAEETDNLSHYEVEKSTNGASFSKAIEVARSSNSSRGSYTTVDANLTKGANFYRVVAVGKDGDRSRFTNTLRFNIAGRSIITILPNGDAAQLGIRFTGVEKGTYQLSVVSAAGQVVMSRQLIHDGNDQTQLIRLSQALSAGVYNVILRGDGLQLNQTFVR